VQLNWIGPKIELRTFNNSNIREIWKS
jgi:hypothetical protein